MDTAIDNLPYPGPPSQQDPPSRAEAVGWSTRLLWLLLATDLVFIGLYFVYMAGLSSDGHFLIEEDRSYGELFQYIKEFWIMLMFGMLLIKCRRLVYGVGLFLFSYLLLDDSLQLHENIAGFLVRSAGWHLGDKQFGLRYQDYGEILVTGTVGGWFILLLALAYKRGAKGVRRVCKHIVVFCFALAFFGVFVDMLNIVMQAFPVMAASMNVLEDGGEMLVMSVMAWYTYALLDQQLPDKGVRALVPAGEMG